MAEMKTQRNDDDVAAFLASVADEKRRADAVAACELVAAVTGSVSAGFDGYADLLGRLGPHRTGKSCLYLKRLADVDHDVLRELVKAGFDDLNGRTLTSEPDRTS